MKAKFLLMVLAAIVFSIGCEKQDSQEVENYVDQLKTGQYDSFYIPEFKTSDIPTLLKYVNDTSDITKFPRNGISSYMQMNCNLGMIILWTIESIRAVEIESDRLIGRFPSQNPILALRDSPADWVFDDSSQFVAAKAYSEWWNSNHLFKDKMKIDPLKDTPYIWH